MTSAPDIVWSYGGAGFPEMAISTTQFDADPQLEVVVASYGGGMVALVDGNSGLAQWIVTPGSGAIWGEPAVEDITGDGMPDVIVTYQGGGIYALNGLSGATLWSRAGISGYPSPKIVDIDASGDLEVIVGSDNDTLYWLTAATGATERAVYMNGNCDVAPAIADVDKDGKLEIAISSSSALYLLNGEDGSVVWTQAAAGGTYSSPTIVDANGDGDLEVIHHSDAGRVYCVSQTGVVLWNSNIGASYSGQPSGTAAADIDGDGIVEIVAGTGTGVVYSLRGTDGATDWSYSVGGAGIHRAVSLVDVDGDGLLEVLVPSPGVSAHPLWCLNPNGTLLWQVDLASGDIHDPSNADVDADGCAELLVATTNGVSAGILLDDTTGASNCGLLDQEDYGLPCVSVPGIRFTTGGILLEVPAPTEGSLMLYDASGRRVATLFSGSLDRGQYTFRPAGLPGGIYLAVFAHEQGVASCVVPVAR